MQNGIRRMLSKIRVAFCLKLSDGWLGGVNYYKNLIRVIVDNPEVSIEPIVFVPCNCDEKLLKDFPAVEIIKTEILDGRDSIMGVVSDLGRRLLGRNIFLEKLLKSKDIDVVSHFYDGSRLKDVAIVAWIPDFQHKYLPEFFSKKEIADRNKSFLQMGELADCVVLSSADALKDYQKFYPEYSDKVAVYQFVVPFEATEYDSIELRKKYNLEGDFFYCPNQFWQHKNHKIIVEALKLLEDSNVQVVCSGNTGDYRNSGYYNQLMKDVTRSDLGNKFRVLGMIPYSDVRALMQECRALLNPSLFEGWNTMVEEGKSLGKRMILSDLNVHKEQNAEGAVYFERNNAVDLAKALVEVLNDNSFDVKGLSERAAGNMKKRERDAAKKYREILDFTLQNFENKIISSVK